MRPTRGDGFLTTPEAAKRIGVDPATIRKWKQRGRIAPDGLDELGRPLYLPATVIAADREVRASGLRASGVDPRRRRKAARRALADAA